MRVRLPSNRSMLSNILYMALGRKRITPTPTKVVSGNDMVAFFNIGDDNAFAYIYKCGSQLPCRLLPRGVPRIFGGGGAEICQSS